MVLIISNICSIIQQNKLHLSKVNLKCTTLFLILNGHTLAVKTVLAIQLLQYNKICSDPLFTQLQDNLNQPNKM